MTEDDVNYNPEIIFYILFTYTANKIRDGTDDIKKHELSEFIKNIEREPDNKENLKLLSTFIIMNEPKYKECNDRFIELYGDKIQNKMTRIIFNTVFGLFMNKMYDRLDIKIELTKVRSDVEIIKKQIYQEINDDKRHKLESDLYNRLFIFFAKYEPLYNIYKEKFLKKSVTKKQKHDSSCTDILCPYLLKSYEVIYGDLRFNIQNLDNTESNRQNVAQVLLSLNICCV